MKHKPCFVSHTIHLMQVQWKDCVTPTINFCTGAHILIPPALGVGQNLKQGKGGYTRHSPNPHYRDTGRGHVGCSSKPDQYDGLVPPELHGWVIDDVGYSIDWEAQEVQQQIQKTLEFLSREAHLCCPSQVDQWYFGAWGEFAQSSGVWAREAWPVVPCQVPYLLCHNHITMISNANAHTPLE